MTLLNKDIEWILEDNPAYDKNPRYPFERTQDKHIEYFNSTNKMMACSADYYRSATFRDPVSNERIYIDFFDHAIITSDRMKLEDENKGTLISYYGSNIIKPVERQLIIPKIFNRRGEHSISNELEDILKSSQGLEFIQTILNTTDGPQEIMESMNTIKRKRSDQTMISVPSYERRKKDAEYIIVFTYNQDWDAHIYFSEITKSYLLSTEGTATGLRQIRTL